MRAHRESAEPVFVDGTGRRRRVFAAAGAAGGVLLAFASVTLMAGFTGAGAASPPTLPAPETSRSHESSRTARPSATIRSTGSPAPRKTARPTSAAPATTGPPVGATASPTRTNHRRVPTHTPGKPAQDKAG